jgi:hypothetical protein
MQTDRQKLTAMQTNDAIINCQSHYKVKFTAKGMQTPRFNNGTLYAVKDMQTGEENEKNNVRLLWRKIQTART